MLLAAIEIGSNATRMIVADYDSDNQLKILNRWSAHLQLGKYVFETGEIPQKQVERLEQLFFQLNDILMEYQPIKLAIFATSAMRDAANQKSVADRIRNIIGMEINILSGQEEASLLMQGVKTFMPLEARDNILADLGGGSLEMNGLQMNSADNKMEILFQQSLDIGTLRLRQMVQEDRDSERELHDSLNPMMSEIIPKLKNAPALILTGGNAKNLAKILPKLSDSYETDQNANQQWLKVHWEEFLRVENILQGESAEQQIKQWGLSKQQSEIFNLALQVFRQIGQKLNASFLSIPFFGLKESLLFHVLKAETAHDQDQVKLRLNPNSPILVEI